jgi:hypothetical protein
MYKGNGDEVESEGKKCTNEFKTACKASRREPVAN